MTKILFILVVASTLTQFAYSQKAVLDITCMETLIANHKVQHTSFSKVKDNETQISLIQKQISEKMVQIEFFQSKFYNSLKSVEAIIKTGKDIIYSKFNHLFLSTALILQQILENIKNKWLNLL